MFDQNSCCEEGGSLDNASQAAAGQEILCDIQDDGTRIPFLRVYEIENGTREFSDYELDGTTAYTLTGPEQRPCDNLFVLPAYIEECTIFPVIVPVNQAGTFSDNTGPTNTLSLDDAASVALIVSALQEAERYQRQEENLGLPITPFIITLDNGNVYEFPPSAFTGRVGNTLSFDQTQVITWPGPDTDEITQISYTLLSNCSCRPVEMVQIVNPDGTSTLLSILDPRNTDFDTGIKGNIGVPPPLGISGPFPGPCPGDIQVLDLENLCCDDDLAANNQAIANLNLAWLDGSDNSLMTAVGGGAVTDGSEVDIVAPKVGAGQNIVIPTGEGAGGPFWRESQVNGLGILDFDGVASRLRLDSGNAAGGPFTFFYLFSTQDVTTSIATLFSVGPNNSDTDAYFNVTGSIQFSRQALNDSFVFRIRVDNAEAGGAPPNIITQVFPSATDVVPPASAAQADNMDISIVPWANLSDGALHLLTASYDDTTNIITFWFDGQLVLQVDMAPMPLTAAAMASDYFRIGGNRLGDSFIDMNLAEFYFADSLLTSEQTAAVNAYIICKWGVDPSLAAGGAGDLSLAPNGSYSAPTPFVRVRLATGDIVYRNLNNGLEFPVPPVPGLSVCADVDCGCHAAAANIVPTERVENGAGNTTANLARLSVVNTGGANATWNGITLGPNEGREYVAYHDTQTNEFKRIGIIAFDATGTTLEISETP